MKAPPGKVTPGEESIVRQTSRETKKRASPNGRAAGPRRVTTRSDGRETKAVAGPRVADGDAAGLRRRVVIEGVRPEVDEGRFPVKSVVGETATIDADIYADGHEEIAADLLYRPLGDEEWSAVPMEPMGNDRWRASFISSEMTTYVFTIEAWIDPFASWREALAKKAAAGHDLSVDLLVGTRLIEEALTRAPEKDTQALRKTAARLCGRTSIKRRAAAAMETSLAARMRAIGDKSLATRYHRELRIEVGPPKAAFSTWYEMFPRSASPVPGSHGTFRDVERRLPYIAGMGFDVLYLPPIHPIGTAHRKGPNNAAAADPRDPGSPWAIGSKLGGHKSVHPDLGTLDDFRRLVRKAGERGIDIALDIALQCSPDHPYVREHPEWFRMRPDGTVQYAENPPKKYEDLYPLNFETEAWEPLWGEIKSIFLFWMEQGVRIFRVDNPHTKPFRFWEWLIAEIRRVDCRAILLSEAFTQPKIMYHLAKLGFSQSYTYFAWRYQKRELTEYFTELTRTAVSDFFRPNAWPNTPDILTEQLQQLGRPAFASRLVLAATLSANYGIYGPAFELMEHAPREPGSEEYLDSEKYEIRSWDINRPDSLRDVITLINKARRENPALQTNRTLAFHETDNDQLIAYSKRTKDLSNIVLCVVNLDTKYTQSGWISVPIEEWGLAPDEPYQVHDLFSGDRYTWQGVQNFVRLNPHVITAHVFRVRKRTGGSDWEFE